MAEKATQTCDEHGRYECANVVMHRYGDADNGFWFGIPVHDGGTSAIAIEYCPWCGTKLPS